MRTPAQLSTQHSCHPRTGQRCPSSSHALPPLTPAHYFPAFIAFLLKPPSHGREAVLPVTGEEPAKWSISPRLRRKAVKEQGTQPDCAGPGPASSPRAEPTHCQVTSALLETPCQQVRKHTSYLPSLPAQILNSSSFYFLLLSTLKAGRILMQKIWGSRALHFLVNKKWRRTVYTLAL